MPSAKQNAAEVPSEEELEKNTNVTKSNLPPSSGGTVKKKDRPVEVKEGEDMILVVAKRKCFVDMPADMVAKIKEKDEKRGRVATTYEGLTVEVNPGEEIEVPRSVARMWQEKGIASVVI